MYVLTVEDSFASAHQLRGYQGKCENIHGHNWKVILSIRGEKLNTIGLLIDFHEIKAMLKSVTSQLDHRNINEVPPFDQINPSSENIASHISELIHEQLTLGHPGLAVESVTVWESDTSRCTYIPSPRYP